jgi:hypothetical protein
VSRKKQKLDRETQINLPLKVEEKKELSPQADFHLVAIGFYFGAHAIACLLSIGYLGLAVQSMSRLPEFRDNIEKLFP